MKRVLWTSTLVAFFTFVATGCSPEPRPEAGFGRAVMEVSADQAEKEGRKQDAHEYRNAAEKYRAEEAEYWRKKGK